MILRHPWYPLVSPATPSSAPSVRLRERTYLAPALISHIHTVPCRCVYACSLLLCQGEFPHFLYSIKPTMRLEWHNKPISHWLHQCCQDWRTNQLKYLARKIYQENYQNGKPLSFGIKWTKKLVPTVLMELYLEEWTCWTDKLSLGAVQTEILVWLLLGDFTPSSLERASLLW